MEEINRDELIDKWRQSGFLDNIDTQFEENIAELYQSQAQFLLEESRNDQAEPTSEQPPVVFPIVRRVFTQLASIDIEVYPTPETPFDIPSPEEIKKMFRYLPEDDRVMF